MENTIDGRPVTIDFEPGDTIHEYKFTFNQTIADFIIYLDCWDKDQKEISYIYLKYIVNNCEEGKSRGDGCKLLCFALKYFTDKDRYTAKSETKVKLEAESGCAIGVTKRDILASQEKLESFYSKFGFEKESGRLFVATIRTVLERCSNPIICQRKTAGRRRKSVVNKKRRRTRRN